MTTIKKIISSEKTLVFADQIIFSGSTFFLTLAMARLLNQKEFGLFSGITLAVYLFLSVSNAIVIQPLQVSLHKIKESDAYLTFSFYLQLAVIAFFLLLVCVLFQHKAANEYNLYLLPVCLYLLGFILHDFFRKSFLASEQFNETLIIDLLSAFGQLVSVIYFSLLENRDFYSVLSVISLTYIPSLVFSLFKQNYTTIPFNQFTTYLSINFKQSTWLLMVSLLQWCSSNFFTLVSGLYIGLEALGAFRLAQSLFGVLNILLQTFENYVLPKASRLYSENVEYSKNYIKRITLQGAFIFIPVLFLLFLFSDQAITAIGGPTYLSYGYVIKLLAVLYAVIYIGYPIRIGIRLLVINRSFFIGYLISFLFSLISFRYLLSVGNLTGAVAGLVINQLLMLAYWQYTLKIKNFSIWK
ncbi:MAG: oligosaccharide flippase family protein [Bacteroidia bacterium]|nr:oligosaccharide flippase family protein [Bacteroidia bacterium]